MEAEGEWIPIEDLKTKHVYDKLLGKRLKTKGYIPRKAHQTANKIKANLTPEERDYW